MNRFRHMQIFSSVVETGQFTKAAAALRVSKSTVSHAINDLENHLGVQLINRTSRSLQITEAGQAYYAESQRILSQLEDLEHSLRDEGGILTGRIRLSAPTIFMALEIAPILTEFLKEHTAIGLDFVLTSKVLDLVDEGIDLAIRFGPLKDSQLIARKLTTISHIVCASPAFVNEHPAIASPKDLESLNCLKFTRNPIWHLTKNGAEYSVQPKGNCVSNDGVVLREMAIAGQGVVFLPEYLAARDLSEGTLVDVLPDYKSRDVDVSLIRPPSQRVPTRVRALMDHIIRTYASDK